MSLHVNVLRQSNEVVSDKWRRLATLRGSYPHTPLNFVAFVGVCIKIEQERKKARGCRCLVVALSETKNFSPGAMLAAGVATT